MSRRIAYLFVAAGCFTFIAPAVADPECFDGVCRMPEVLELQLPPAPAADDPNVANASVTAKPVQQAAEHEQLRSGPAPEPVRPQMRVDDLPRPALRPVPLPVAEKQIEKMPQPVVEKQIEKTAVSEKTAEKAMAKSPAKPVRQVARELARQAPPVIEESVQPSEPVEVVSRRYTAPEPQRNYALYPQPVQPSAGVVIVAPGAQYGDDGIAVANARQDSSWQLCQTDRPGAGHNRCIQYNYQPYGASGYRPLGTYRAYRSSPSYVYVPDAKVITID
jgi:hypothetical protein